MPAVFSCTGIWNIARGNWVSPIPFALSLSYQDKLNCCYTDHMMQQQQI